MPFLICVNKPGNLPEIDPTAAATLVDAIEAAEAHIDTSQDALGEEDGARRYFEPARRHALALGPDGGVISLPDGYVIDVTPVSYRDLAERAGIAFQTVPHPGPRYEGIERDQARIIDAYNRGV